MARVARNGSLKRNEMIDFKRGMCCGRSYGREGELLGAEPFSAQPGSYVSKTGGEKVTSLFQLNVSAVSALDVTTFPRAGKMIEREAEETVFLKRRLKASNTFDGSFNRIKLFGMCRAAAAVLSRAVW